jgi:hypothetical protein
MPPRIMTPGIKPFLPQIIIHTDHVYERGERFASSSGCNEGICIQAFMHETVDSNGSGLADSLTHNL